MQVIDGNLLGNSYPALDFGAYEMLSRVLVLEAAPAAHSVATDVSESFSMSDQRVYD